MAKIKRHLHSLRSPGELDFRLRVDSGRGTRQVDRPGIRFRVDKAHVGSGSWKRRGKR